MNKSLVGIVGVFLLVVSLYVAMFSAWMVDVSVGAISVDGCVTQGTNCINPMVFYHQYLRILSGVIFISHVVIGVGIVVFLRQK